MIEVNLYIYTLDVVLLSKEGLVSHYSRRGVHLDPVLRLDTVLRPVYYDIGTGVGVRSSHCDRGSLGFYLKKG